MDKNTGLSQPVGQDFRDCPVFRLAILTHWAVYLYYVCIMKKCKLLLFLVVIESDKLYQ